MYLVGLGDWKLKATVLAVINSFFSQLCNSKIIYSLCFQTGKRIKLSEQQLVDCTWGFGNRGCKGGYPYRAMQWIIKHGGIATAQSYGRYLAQVNVLFLIIFIRVYWQSWFLFRQIKKKLIYLMDKFQACPQTNKLLLTDRAFRLCLWLLSGI